MKTVLVGVKLNDVVRCENVTTVRRRKRTQDPTPRARYGQGKGGMAVAGDEICGVKKKDGLSDEVIRSINESIGRSQHNRRIVNEIKANLNREKLRNGVGKDHKVKSNYTTNEFDLVSFSPGCFSATKSSSETSKPNTNSHPYKNSQLYVISSSQDPRSFDAPISFEHFRSQSFKRNETSLVKNLRTLVSPVVYNNCSKLVVRSSKILSNNDHAPKDVIRSFLDNDKLIAPRSFKPSTVNSYSEEAQLAYVDHSTSIFASGCELASANDFSAEPIGRSNARRRTTASSSSRRFDMHNGNCLKAKPRPKSRGPARSKVREKLGNG